MIKSSSESYSGTGMTSLNLVVRAKAGVPDAEVELAVGREDKLPEKPKDDADVD